MSTEKVLNVVNAPQNPVPRQSTLVRFKVDSLAMMEPRANDPIIFIPAVDHGVRPNLEDNVVNFHLERAPPTAPIPTANGSIMIQSIIF